MNVVLHLLLLLFCRNAFCLDTCYTQYGFCGCCKNNYCAYSYDTYTYYCKDGCVDGYYGEQCRQACPSNCLTCTNDYSCDSCKPGYSCYTYSCNTNNKCTQCSSNDKCYRCAPGYYGSLCEHECSQGCLNNFCSISDGDCYCKTGYSGYKCDECIPGKYGIACDQSCPSNCLTCFDSESCSSCQKGFWGNKCQWKCSVGCISCDKRTENCNSDCQDGFYGFDCQACPANCERCSSATECNVCKPKYWGKLCESSCHSNCKSCVSNTSCTTCHQGFFGPVCNTECPSNCRDRKCSKLDGACSSCNVGFFGRHCEFNCPERCANGLCYKHSGICLSCINGYLGLNCTNKCPVNCLQCFSDTLCSACLTGYKGQSCKDECLNCREGTTCNIFNGHCDVGCAAGYWGNMCIYRCSDNCRDKVCLRNNGYCIKGCKAGYTSPKCSCPINCECNANDVCIRCKNHFKNTHRYCTCREDLCSNMECTRCIAPDFYPEKFACCPCSTTCKNNACESASKCSFGCNEGYRGDGCSERCRDVDLNCSECTVDFTLDKGKCLKCMKGYHLGNASKFCLSCSDGCVNEICNGTNGECTSGCKDGKWGTRCERLCSNNCQKCDHENGTCLVCKAGKYLSDCSRSCNTNCNSSNGEKICAIGNGACLNGCDTPEKYGTRCENVCNSNCIGNRCDWKTGDCASGCIFNHYGKKCQNECNVNCKEGNGTSPCDPYTGNCVAGCNDGYFGNSCDQKCSPNCVNDTCQRITGTCILGCTYGYEGADCMQNALKSSESGTKAVVKIGLAIGVVVLVTIIFGATVAFLIIKRRNNERKDESSNLCENNFDNTVVTYSEVQAREIEVDEDNAVYAKPNKPKKRTEEESRMTYKPNIVLEVLTTSNQMNKKENDKRKTDCNPYYEESIDDTNLEKDTSFDDITKTNYVNCKLRINSKKTSLAAKPRVVYENTEVTESVIKMSRAEYALRQRKNTVLEIEEDLGNITSLASKMDQFRKEYLKREKEGEYAYYNVAEMKKRKVPLNKLAEYVSKKTKEEFIEEFDTLPVGLIKSFTESQKTENLTKNRYRGLYPYDQKRVILKGGDSDYINASFVDGYKKIKAYIASIGPTNRYMEDMSPFWRMVWQEKAGKIVMLTKLSEAEVPKCDQYWPEKDCSILFADISVTTEREEAYADYTVRTFILQKDSKATKVVQVQFMAWPDKGIPDDVTSLIEFRQKVNSISTDLDGPVVVHCSAGVGRTGTYIAIDSLIHEGEGEGGVDIYACVRNLREQRVNMVQTAEQYQYLHNAVVHTLTFGSHPIKASKFHEYMSTHATNRLGNQFQQLEAFVESRADDEKEAVGLNKELKNQNRSGADIPGYNNRPRLYLRRKQGRSGYINAVYINSFRTKNRFLVAQTPLPNTAEDFLTLIVQENVSCIVTMETSLTGNKTVGTYYPDDSQPLKVGSCTVQSEMAECTKQYVQRKLKILYQGKSSTQEVTVTHIQFKKWIERQKPPDDPKMFMRFVKDVELKCNGDDMERPILVHCLTGAEKSGLFCVVSILLEKIQLEQEISVVNTVRQVKNRRHKSIPNKEQYIFCHQCLDEYLHTFDTYSNFCLEK